MGHDVDHDALGVGHEFEAATAVDQQNAAAN
jgi:hypothetical protein